MVAREQAATGGKHQAAGAGRTPSRLGRKPSPRQGRAGNSETQLDASNLDPGEEQDQSRRY